MAEKIGGLTVELTGEAKGLIEAVKSSSAAIQKLIPSFKGMAGAVAMGNAAWAAASQAMGMAKAATVDLVASSMQFIDANNDIAAKTGISTESLGMLEYAARMNGTEFETLTKSVGKMLKVVGEVQSGNDDAAKSFEAIGISLEQVKNLSTEDLLGAVADGIKELPSTAMQASAAMNIFGKSGADLLPMLQGGSEGIAQMTQEASNLGLMIGTIDSAKVGQANDAIDKMKFLFKGVGNILAVEISPLIEGAISQTIEWANSGKGLRENVGGALEYILEGAAKVGDFTMTLQEGFNRVAAIVESAFALIPMGLETAFDAVVATVNGAISAMNQLPGVNIGLIAPREEAFSASKQILDDAKEHIKKADELAAQQGKYGESVKQWIQGARDSAQATAEANATNPTSQISTEENPVSDAMKKSAESMVAATRTPLEQYKAKLEEINNLSSAGLIDADTQARAMQGAWDDLQKASGGYGDSIKDATGSVNDMGKALENLGSAGEVDLGALTGGAQLLGGSSFSSGLADYSSGTFGANDLKAMQFGDAAALKDYQFGDAAALKDYQFGDMAALKDMQFGGDYSNGGNQDPSGVLAQIRDILASILQQGGQPSTVQFGGGLTSEYST